MPGHESYKDKYACKNIYLNQLTKGAQKPLTVKTRPRKEIVKEIGRKSDEDHSHTRGTVKKYLKDRINWISQPSFQREAAMAILGILGISFLYLNCTGGGFQLSSALPSGSPTLNSATGAITNPSSGTSTAPSAAPSSASQSGHLPTGITGNFTNIIDATFGTSISDATVKNRNDLDNLSYYWFIDGAATTDPKSNFQSAAPNNCHGPHDGAADGHPADFSDLWIHCDPGSPWDRHVMSTDRLTLKSTCGLADSNTGNCAPGNIGGGMLRFITPLRPTTNNPVVIEMKAIIPKGLGSWPAFWLSPGQQAPRNPDGTPGPMVIPPSWPPEIDIFDEFGFDGATPGTYLIAGTPNNGDMVSYASALCVATQPCDHLPLTTAGPVPFQSSVMSSIQTTQSGITYGTPVSNLTTNWHIYGAVIYTDHIDLFLDGVLYRKMGYTWPAASPPMHLILSNQTGPLKMNPNNLALIQDQGGVPNGWNWDISYVRAWQMK